MVVWPASLIPSGMRWYQIANGSEFVSPFSGTTQTVDYPGTRWGVDLTFENMSDTEARLLEVFLYSMSIGERCLLGDFGRNQGAAKGTPLVATAVSTGKVIASKGWTASTKVALLGDYISIGNELKMVTADVTSSSTGTANIPVVPSIRGPFAANAAIQYAKPVALFRLSDKEQGVDRKPAMNNDFSFTLVEAFF